MHTLFDFITYTKAVEYLIAVGFLAVFIGFWRLINAAPSPARAPAAASDWVARVGDYVGGFLLPDSLYYHPGHAWVRDEANAYCTVGLDDFSQKLVGKIDAVNLPPVGTTLTQGEPAWTLQVNGKPIRMLAPVSGEVAMVNREVLATPDLVHREPFGKGWLLQVRTPRKRSVLKNLLAGTLAKRWLEEARAQLVAAPAGALGVVLTDAGPARVGLAAALDPERWDEVARRFLLTAEDNHEPAQEI